MEFVSKSEKKRVILFDDLDVGEVYVVMPVVAGCGDLFLKTTARERFCLNGRPRVSDLWTGRVYPAKILTVEVDDG